LLQVGKRATDEMPAVERFSHSAERSRLLEVPAVRGRRLTLLVRSVTLLLLLLLAVPVVSKAAVFVGSLKTTGVCPGVSAVSLVHPFSLDIEPGAGDGLAIASGSAVVVITDWLADGTFSATAVAPVVGAIVHYGKIKGTKLKGYFISHTYPDGCIITGKLSAQQVQ